MGKAGSVTGVLLRSPVGLRIEHAVHFKFTITNNEVEYEAFLEKTRMVTTLSTAMIKIHMDLQLVTCQIKENSYPRRKRCPSISLQC